MVQVSNFTFYLDDAGKQQTTTVEEQKINVTQYLPDSGVTPRYVQLRDNP